MHIDGFYGCCSVKILNNMYDETARHTDESREKLIKERLRTGVETNWDGAVLCVLADYQVKDWSGPLIKNGFVLLTEPFLAKAHDNKLSIYMKQINGEVCFPKQPKKKAVKAAVKKDIKALVLQKPAKTTVRRRVFG